ncbi:MAG: exopolysaccharide biosynthesis protein [Anaerolineae bacterium]
MPVELSDPKKGLSETLSSVASGISAERITLRELLEMVGEQGMLVFCILLTIPFLLPVSIPGVSTVFGVIIFLIGIGVALNRIPWLPEKLMNRAIESSHIIPALERASIIFVRLDRLIRPRLLTMTHGTTINRVNGILLVIAALLLMAPFGAIPLTNTLPAVAILFLASGMLQRDGLFVIGGYLAVVSTIIYFSILLGGAFLAGHGLNTLLTS